MKFLSPLNKFLTLNPTVVLTEHIDPVIHALDKEFQAAGIRAKVTSGWRDPASQLRIIRNALVNKGLADDYPEAFEDMTGKFTWEGQEVYNWQPGWSKLLNVGFIVNPPLTARCLMDYFRPGSMENKKGQLIGSSPHFRGGSFDIGGGLDGVNQEATVIKNSMGKVKGLKGYLIERNQNCVHCDCNFIDMTNNI